MKMSEIKAWSARLGRPILITPEVLAQIMPLVSYILRQKPIPDSKMKEASDVLDDFARRCKQRGSRL